MSVVLFVSLFLSVFTVYSQIKYLQSGGLIIHSFIKTEITTEYKIEDSPYKDGQHKLVIGQRFKNMGRDNENYGKTGFVTGILDQGEYTVRYDDGDDGQGGTDYDYLPWSQKISTVVTNDNCNRINKQEYPEARKACEDFYKN